MPARVPLALYPGYGAGVLESVAQHPGYGAGVLESVAQPREWCLSDRRSRTRLRHVLLRPRSPLYSLGGPRPSLAKNGLDLSPKERFVGGEMTRFGEAGNRHRRG